jgi:hypothetical protein
LERYYDSTAMSGYEETAVMAIQDIRQAMKFAAIAFPMVFVFFLLFYESLLYQRIRKDFTLYAINHYPFHQTVGIYYLLYVGGFGLALLLSLALAQFWIQVMTWAGGYVVNLIVLGWQPWVYNASLCFAFGASLFFVFSVPFSPKHLAKRIQELNE